MLFQICLGVLAALFTAYSVYITLHSNLNFGVLLVWGLTAFVWLVLLFRRPLGAFAATLPGKVCFALLGLGGLLLAGLLAFVAISGHTNRAKGDEQALVVLGAAIHGSRISRVLQYRLDAAYDYYCQNPAVVIVTTGGQGPQEDLAEGEAMRQYLLQKGVPPANLIAETQSVSTEENFTFAADLLAQAGFGPDVKVAFCTNAFHCYRAGQYALRAGFVRPTALPAPISAGAVPTCYLREAFAVLYYWVFKSSGAAAAHPVSRAVSSALKNGWRV